MSRTRKKYKKYIVIAIDEAGRGPLAGPIAVAAVAATAMGPLNRWKIQTPKILKGIKDSKKLSPKQRRVWFEIIKKNFEYKVTMVSSAVIDRMGIQKAAKLAISRVLRKFGKKPDLVLLDGLLTAPQCYNQRTIVKGDQKIALIAAASIIAKVSRDRKMERIHKICPQYFFNKNKGYGTKLHRQMIKKYHFSKYHRRSFNLK